SFCRYAIEKFMTKPASLTHAIFSTWSMANLLQIPIESNQDDVHGARPVVSPSGSGHALLLSATRRDFPGGRIGEGMSTARAGHIADRRWARRASRSASTRSS